jgi:hypothetical protein
MRSGVKKVNKGRAERVRSGRGVNLRVGRKTRGEEMKKGPEVKAELKSGSKF